MTNCCEHHAITNGCNQGKSCPVRAARDAGACTPEQEDAQYKDDMVVYIVLLIACYTLVCAFFGYLWGTHGAAIELFLWALASKLF